jgi:flavin reductase (DIM6/NTAB) family NADH-FMN oxidoreductase RutF
MHYDPRKRDHGLPHDPFLSLVVPRPIGWISTVGKDGVVNLAPYSYFAAVCSNPAHVVFGSAGRKDSMRNAEETGEFVVNLATWTLREAMNESSANFGPHESEPMLTGRAMAASINVGAPRVAQAPAALECLYVSTTALTNEAGEAVPHSIILGRVVGVYIEDAILREGQVDLRGLGVLSRLGYMEYGVLDTIFTMARPAQRPPAQR